MRIAIIHENSGSGAGRCAQDLRRALAEKHTISYFPRPNTVETTDGVLRELSGFGPDVVHCHSFYGGLPYKILPIISDLYPTCFTVHDPRPIGTMHRTCWTCEENATCRQCPLIRAGWRRLLRNPYFHERKLKREAHKRCGANMQIVSPSRWMLERLAAQELSRFGLHHIPNGIDLNHFRHILDGRVSFGLPVDRPIVLFAAWNPSNRVIDCRKGLPDLAAAFVTHVIPVMPKAMLVVAGESFAPNHPNVVPVGLISYDRLPQLFSAVDVFVTATLADNLPYTVLEAMGCATPVVATNVGGIPEQVVDGETGFLVPPSQPAALGAAILEILSNPSRARLMGRNARHRAKEIYSMESFVDAYEALFQKMGGLRC
jgi:glycosyltransferase involved in cell wall biosynthesis